VASQVSIQVSRPNSATYLFQIPIFEWGVVRCRSKNRQQKDMYFRLDWTTAQKLLAILGTTINIIEGTQLAFLQLTVTGCSLFIKESTLAPNYPRLILISSHTFTNAQKFQPCESNLYTVANSKNQIRHIYLTVS
jgi:hypothetical protein